MKDLLDEGIIFFNAGRYYEAHESWEDLWRATSGADRSFIQGLVQAAVALHHIKRGNRRGGSRVLERGIHKLETYGEHHLGINNILLLNHLRAILATQQVPDVRIEHV